MTLEDLVLRLPLQLLALGREILVLLSWLRLLLILLIPCDGLLRDLSVAL